MFKDSMESKIFTFSNLSSETLLVKHSCFLEGEPSVLSGGTGTSWKVRLFWSQSGWCR